MNEFIHFITLNRRSKNKLFSCLESLHSLNEINQESYQLIHDHIASKKDSQAIKSLMRCAKDTNQSDNGPEFFWNTIHQVTVGHKMLKLHEKIRSAMNSEHVKNKVNEQSGSI
jgi:hypothetical protein